MMPLDTDRHAHAGAKPDTTTAPNAIELVGVSKQFRLGSGRTVTAVDDVSLTIPDGQFVCLLGPSGHGKSTLLSMLAGFTAPDQGQILAAGSAVTGPGPDRGVVFQRDTLFSWRRVGANVGFGLAARGVKSAERRRIVDHYLKLTGLERYAKAWPKQLSGGMRRRVAIAMVFANQPEILLMDEPFVGLDYSRRADLYAILESLREELGCTMLFITHEIDEALILGDRMLVMVGGSIVLDEPIDLDRPRDARAITSPRAQELKTAVIERLGAAQILDEDR